MIDLGDFGARDAFALAINNKRQVVLALQDESGQRMGIYDQGHLKIVEAPGWTTGLAINESGHVVGTHQSPEEPGIFGRAFYYDGLCLHDLHVPGQFFSSSRSINNKDEIVGSWVTASPQGGYFYGGFLYRDGQRTDLSEMLPPGSGWTIYTADRINDFGQIVGVGIYGGVGKFYMMTPTRLP
jgi:hypothetical protein